MTMEIKAALYPVTDGEVPKAKEALDGFKTVVLEPMGAYVGGLAVIEATEPFPGTEGERTVVKIHGHIHFNDGRAFSFGFGAALAALKAGKRVTRAGWNGTGMWLAYQKGYPDGIAINANTAQATGLPEGTVCRFLPYLMMKTVDGSFVPWLASQADLLAEDWMIVE